jgi:dephospho-CoA kinase
MSTRRLIVGLTGGIASGKSQVRKYFQQLGAVVVDVDQVAHEVYLPGKPAWKKIVEVFGKEILYPDQTINREKLGKIIFPDERKRKNLNRLLHPYIAEALKESIKEKAQVAQQGIVLVEGAIILEQRWIPMDRVIIVLSEPEQQRERLMKRDRLSREEAEVRISAQSPWAEMIKQADFVIDNRRTEEEAQKQVGQVWQELKSIATTNRK